MEYYEYQLRITFSGELNEDYILPHLKTLKCVGGKEIGKKTEKPHCHIFIRDHRKMEALRVWLKRKMPLLNGSGKFSIGLKKKDDCMLYCIKEKNIIVNTLLTDDELSEALEKTYDSKSKDNQREKKNLKDYIIENYEPLILDDYDGKHLTSDIRIKLTSHVYSYITEMPFPKGLYFNRQNIGDIYNTILYNYYPVIRKDLMGAVMNEAMGYYH